VQPSQASEKVQAADPIAAGHLDAAPNDANPRVLVHARDEPVEPTCLHDDIVLERGEVLAASHRARELQSARKAEIHARVDDARPRADGVHARGGTCTTVVDDYELEGDVRFRRDNAVQALLEQIDPLPRDDKDRDDRISNGYPPYGAGRVSAGMPRRRRGRRTSEPGRGLVARTLRARAGAVDLPDSIQHAVST
jgi:hypothetical protein